METSCCGNLFCHFCATKSYEASYGKCPLCKSPGHFLPSQYMRQRIGEMRVGCRIEGCEHRLLHRDRKKHEALCIHKCVSCYFCRGQVSKKALPEHMLNEHREQVDEILKRLVDVREHLGPRECEYDPGRPAKNEAGRTAALGLSGKHYCGCKLECPDLSLTCGPSKGENCRSCMRLDTSVRGLEYGKYLVNDRGRIALVEESRVYCGIRISPVDIAEQCWKASPCDSC